MSREGMTLYHVGSEEIREPDIRRGRKNADFGQGFYTTPDRGFGERWAKEGGPAGPRVNIYRLDTEDLKILRLERDAAWFDYIYGNRHLMPDPYGEYDVIIGPIANDTIYDVLGITTSGFLEKDLALQLLMLGPAYRQVTLKTDKAAGHLRFLASEEIGPEKAASYREIVRREQEEYQRLFAKTMAEIAGED